MVTGQAILSRSTGQFWAAADKRTLGHERETARWLRN